MKEFLYKYLTALIVTLGYCVCIVGAIALIMMMSRSYRVTFIVAMVFVVLPALYRVVYWVFEMRGDRK